MPADSLARYSAGVSECGCFTSQHVARGWRCGLRGYRFMPSPLRERSERPRPRPWALLDWVCVGCFLWITEWFIYWSRRVPLWVPGLAWCAWAGRRFAQYWGLI